MITAQFSKSNYYHNFQEKKKSARNPRIKKTQKKAKRKHHWKYILNRNGNSYYSAKIAWFSLQKGSGVYLPCNKDFKEMGDVSSQNSETWVGF